MAQGETLRVGTMSVMIGLRDFTEEEYEGSPELGDWCMDTDVLEQAVRDTIEAQLDLSPDVDRLSIQVVVGD
jgi:hypothetical protein